MRVRFLVALLVVLLGTPIVFTLYDLYPEVLIFFSVIAVILLGIVCFEKLKDRPFLEKHSSLLSSEDPKVLLELSEKCEAYLKDRNSVKVRRLAQQVKDKREKIQREQAKMETFKSAISEDGSHPRVVSTLKENMHTPDSFQHVSSEYETIEKDGEFYHKIVMTFRGTNTFNALVLQTYYFLVDADNQISFVGSPDDTGSSPVNTAKLAETAMAVSIAFEGVATLADMLLFFTRDEE